MLVREAFAEASRFRDELYACLTVRGDELFELADAVLCAPGAVHSAVELTLLPEHRRGHGAMHDGLNQGRIDSGRLRSLLASLPLPRFPDGRLQRFRSSLRHIQYRSHLIDGCLTETGLTSSP